MADDARIRAALPTLEALRGRGAKLVVASHLGRPKGKRDDATSLRPVADVLAGLLAEPVVALGSPAPGREEVPADAGVVLLENLRFDPGEEADDTAFAGRLADLADAYVDDAFGSAHRRHASVAGLPELMLASGRPAVAGLLMQREVEVLSTLLHDPARPYVAILGGAKVSDKLDVIGSLLPKVDALLVGGAMAFTLLAARGGSVGASLVEPDHLEQVRAVEAEARDHGIPILLPVDVVAAGEISAGAQTRLVPADEIPEGLLGLDIGPQTVEAFSGTIRGAATVFWNGPMGVFELERFAAGTMGVAKAVANSDAFSVVGGGDSLLAIKRSGLQDAFSHLSTGGGASLEFLEGRQLPGIEVLRGGW